MVFLGFPVDSSGIFLTSFTGVFLVIPRIPCGFLRNIPDLFLVYQGMWKEQSRNPQGMNQEKPQVKMGFLGMLCVHQDSLWIPGNPRNHPGFLQECMGGV